MLDICTEVHLDDGIWRICHAVIDETGTGYADEVEFTEFMDEKTGITYYFMSFRRAIYSFRTLFEPEYRSWKKYFGTAV